MLAGLGCHTDRFTIRLVVKDLVCFGLEKYIASKDKSYIQEGCVG